MSRKEKPLRSNAGAISNATAKSSMEPSAVQHSWRDFYEPHPAALVFNRHTTDEDRKKMSEDLKENQRLQARIVTAHVADESGGKTYVVDGITRLEEMEKLGWQIVDEHGKWIGQLEGMFDHRRNYTHKQVGKLVVSLNAKRRHTEKSIVADAIIEALKLERKTDKGGFSQSKRETSPQVGRPRDEFKAEAVKRGAEAGLSKSTIEKSLSKQPERPKITKPAKRKQPKKEKPFDRKVWDRWLRWMKQWTPEEVRGVKKLVHKWTEVKA